MPNVNDWLPRDSVLGALMGAFDWSATSVGPIERWPQSLKTALSIMLGCRYPLLVWWGPEQIHFYNDAFLPLLGEHHPGALGRPAAEVWSEAWSVIGPQAHAVMRDGKSYSNDELPIVTTRKGYAEEVYMTLSYSPIRDDDGNIGGVLCACTEETPRVLGRRRLATLRALADQSYQATSATEACAIAAAELAQNAYDLPFFAVYLLEADGRSARLAGHAGLPAAVLRAELIDIEHPRGPWPLREVMTKGEPVALDALPASIGSGPWPEPVQRALVLPMVKPGQRKIAGFIVAGTSPRLPFDESYRAFLDLVAAQVATALANAEAYAEERRRAGALAELDRAKTAFFSNVSEVPAVPSNQARSAADHGLRSTRGQRSVAEELSAQLGDSRQVNADMRDSRRATLNVLEDVVEARDHAEHLYRELRERERWLRGQREALIAAVNGASLAESLGALVRTAKQALGPQVRAAFYLANDSLTTLHHVVGMSADYAKAVDGFLIGPESLACGLSTHTGEPVITPDVQTDPRWVPWRWMAQEHGYRSCWSFSVLTAAGKFVGTLAVYGPEPRQATARDLELAAVLTNTAAIIVSQHTQLEVRKQAEHALRESELRSRSLIEGLAQATWETNAEGRVIKDSPSWRAYTGQTSEECLGDGWIDAVHPEDRAYAQARWQEAVATQQPIDAEFRIRHPPVGFRWTNVRAVPLISEQGEVQKWVGMNIDIEARKQAEEVVRRSQAQQRGPALDAE